MKIACEKSFLCLLLSLVLLLSISPVLLPGTTVSADSYPLQWKVVDTPNSNNRVIASPSEINRIVISLDSTIFYALDTPNNKLYKSTDNGITWEQELSNRLIMAGAQLPIWDIASPADNSNLLVAVTDGDGSPNGPKNVFISGDGGQTWNNTNLPALPANEYISCVDISGLDSGNKRDLAIGTRNGTGNGNVWILKTTDAGISVWNNQCLAPSTGWTNGDVITLKFSPNYNIDESIVVITSNTGGMYLNLGDRDILENSTAWNILVNYPVLLRSDSGNSPDHTEIITADLELPSNFGEESTATRHYFISTDAYDVALTSYIGALFRVDNAIVTDITPPDSDRISSIAYYYDIVENDVLLAGEVESDPNVGKVNVWRCENPEATYPTWPTRDSYRPPTGGANSGYANAQLMFGLDGEIVYCGTSSADFQSGGTNMVPGSGQWPEALLNTSNLDESAFSVSPYLDSYKFLRKSSNKSQDSLVGNVWNQISLIDTEITYLSDIAALQGSAGSSRTADYDVIYLTTMNTNVAVANNFDSVWRNCGSSTNRIWERILCLDTSDNDTIVRINPKDPQESPTTQTYGNRTRSDVVVFADLLTDTVLISMDEGQAWESVHTTAQVTDLTLLNDIAMFILEDTTVYRGSLGNNNIWTWPAEQIKSTGLVQGHTIDTPLKNRESVNSESGYEEWVLVGDTQLGEAAYADYSLPRIKFERIPADKYGITVPGNTHVRFDEKFYQNNMIYTATHDLALGNRGKIYRWTIGESTRWLDLNPPNSAFYGLAQRNQVLYGAWNTATPPNTPPGVDRTLNPTFPIPPPVEWDDLTTGLPTLGDINYAVAFTREPSSLKISSDGTENNLWAIDNRTYNWNNKIGCLWTYNDPAISIGPWSISPYSGEYILIDPVTGRADEINFKWRQLIYAYRYQLQLSKNESFSMTIINADNITTPDLQSPAWILFPGFLDANHTYYWRVRARGAMSGENVLSPWSATMYFHVQAGLPVVHNYLAPALLDPKNDCGCPCSAPVCFSWSPFKETITYQFLLSENADMSNPIVDTVVNTTAYRYDDVLKCGTNYFWRVRAIEPWESEWSATFSFQTEPKLTAKTKEVVIQHTSWWIWLAVGIYVVLVFAIVYFLRKTRTDY